MRTTHIKIRAADKITVQETDEQLLSVLFDIMQGDQVVQTLRQGFPLDITEDALTVELQQVLSTFVSDAENTARNATIDAANEQADETIAAVIGKEIIN